MADLKSEVSSQELCEQMAANPVLAEAFKDSALVWSSLFVRNGEKVYEPVPRLLMGGVSPFAPTVREMLVWLHEQERDRLPPRIINRSWKLWAWKPQVGGGDKLADITDPNELALACLAAASGGA